jgi:hypothetical protein
MILMRLTGALLLSSALVACASGQISDVADLDAGDEGATRLDATADHVSTAQDGSITADAGQGSDTSTTSADAPESDDASTSPDGGGVDTGSCAAGQACTPTNPCHTGATACSTGTPVCNDTGTSVADGTTCGSSSVCESGTCTACGGTSQLCCPGGTCSTSPDQCIGAVASTCRTNVTPQCICGTLQQGQELTAGESLWSCDGKYELIMQTDGNLVLYDNGGVLWSTATTGTGATFVIMQDDGNLVVYTAASVPEWSSNTAGHGCGVYLAVQTDGNVVVYTSGGTALWASGT